MKNQNIKLKLGERVVSYTGEYRKKRYLKWLLILGTITLASFFIEELFFTGSYIEGVADFIAFLLLGFSLYDLVKNDAYKRVARICSAVICYIPLQSFVISTDGVSYTIFVVIGAIFLVLGSKEGAVWVTSLLSGFLSATLISMFGLIPLPFSAGNPLRLIAMASVLSIIIYLHKSLAEEAEYKFTLQQIFDDNVIENTPGMFFVTGEKGDLIKWNKQFGDMSGFQVEDSSKRNIRELFEGIEVNKINRHLEDLRRQEFVQSEVILTNPKGKSIPAILYARSMSMEDRMYVVGALLDISELKEIQKENVSIKKLQSRVVDQIVESLVPTISNLNAEIDKFTSGVGDNLDTVQKQSVASMRDLGDSVISDSKDLFLILEIRSGNVKFNDMKCDLNTIMAEVVSKEEQDAMRKGIAILYTSPNTMVPVINSDLQKLKEMLTRIISLAVNHSKEDKTVEVKMEYEEGEKEVKLCVCDNSSKDNTEEIKGSIIDLEDAEQDIPEAVDLGLSISVFIAKRLGGQLEFEYVPGHGNRVLVKLPVAEIKKD